MESNEMKPIIKKITKKEALQIALNALTDFDYDKRMSAIESIKEALETKDEPVAVKRMMEWVYVLKRRSDNGQHMNIQSGLTAGTCWEFAIELEEFIKHFSSQRTWVCLTDKEVDECLRGLPTQTIDVYARRIKTKIKEKNT
jgi:hypothetical protein